MTTLALLATLGLLLLVPASAAFSAGGGSSTPSSGRRTIFVDWEDVMGPSYENGWAGLDTVRTKVLDVPGLRSAKGTVTLRWDPLIPTTDRFDFSVAVCAPAGGQCQAVPGLSQRSTGASPVTLRLDFPGNGHSYAGIRLMVATPFQYGKLFLCGAQPFEVSGEVQVVTR